MGSPVALRGKRTLTRVVLVDDQPLFVEGFMAALANLDDMVVTSACSTLASGIAAMMTRPDILVCDVRLPDGSGFDLLAEASHRCPSSAVVLLAPQSAPHLADASLRLGASGFLLKTYSAADIVTALHQIARGAKAYVAATIDSPECMGALTRREHGVLEGLLAARTNDEIAWDLKISRKTVEVYLSRLFVRTGSLSRTELAVKAEREGWLMVPFSAQQSNNARTVRTHRS